MPMILALGTGTRTGGTARASYRLSRRSRLGRSTVESHGCVKRFLAPGASRALSGSAIDHYYLRLGTPWRRTPDPHGARALAAANGTLGARKNASWTARKAHFGGLPLLSFILFCWSSSGEP